MERNPRTASDEQLYQEAGEWFLEFREGEPSVDTRREFDQWVRRSPNHLAAYLEIAAIWNEAPALAAEDKSVLTARAAGENDNVVGLGVRNSRAAAQAPVRPRLFARAGVKAAAILVLGVGAATWLWSLNQFVYSTGIGEQRTIALKDGSRVELNSRSKLKVRYTQDERAVELVEGQALFSVAKDSSRPFVVASDNARVRAVGTQFDVYRKPTGTVVTVVEGQVAIGDGAASLALSSPQTAGTLQPIVISAGQQLIVTRSEIKKPVAANVANVTAWTQQQLVFEAATLSEVAEEFNRYNERHLLIRDSGAFNFRISGIFSSSDPAGLIRFLRDRPGIRVLESSSQITVERIEGNENERNSYPN
jgi:transmembrane sensor